MQRVLVVLLAAIVGFAAWSYFSHGIINTLLDPNVSPEVRLETLRTYFDGWGILAPLAYVFVVAVEVVIAPLPGLLLYLPGGVIFGWVVGAIASLIGNIIGATFACLFTRTLNKDNTWLNLDSEALKRYQGILERRGFWIIFLLRVNPLTSSDLISYAAGLTKIPVWKAVLATTLGMAPLCFLQAYFSEALFSVFPVLIYPMVLITTVYVIYVVKITKDMSRPKAPNRGILGS